VIFFSQRDLMAVKNADSAPIQGAPGDIWIDECITLFVSYQPAVRLDFLRRKK